jgi:hypothetical protein
MTAVGHTASRDQENVVAKTRRTEKVVEIHEFYVIRSVSGSMPALCWECAAGDAIMVPPEQAAVLAQVSVRMIYRWVETGTIHYRESSTGSIIVCVKSLPATSDQVIGA